MCSGSSDDDGPNAEGSAQAREQLYQQLYLRRLIFNNIINEQLPFTIKFIKFSIHFAFIVVFLFSLMHVYSEFSYGWTDEEFCSHRLYIIDDFPGDFIKDNPDAIWEHVPVEIPKPIENYVGSKDYKFKKLFCQWWEYLQGNPSEDGTVCKKLRQTCIYVAKKCEDPEQKGKYCIISWIAQRKWETQGEAPPYEREFESGVKENYTQVPKKSKT